MANTEKQKSIVCILTRNNYGVLARISSMFCRRNFNIYDITAAVTDDHGLTRITITVDGDERILSQIVLQTRNLQDVVEVQILDRDETLERELVLIKVAANKENRNELREISEIYKAKIIDLCPDSMVFELTGKPSKIEGFMTMMKDYEILEMSCTGITALQRGSGHIRSFRKEESV